jgi:hypothetical protein
MAIYTRRRKTGRRNDPDVPKIARRVREETRWTTLRNSDGLQCEPKRRPYVNGRLKEYIKTI